jgi:hypothetical protein
MRATAAETHSRLQDVAIWIGLALQEVLQDLPSGFAIEARAGRLHCGSIASHVTRIFRKEQSRQQLRNRRCSPM